MKQMIFIALLASCLALPAQETRHEVIHSSGNPAVDTKPNSNKVPDGIAINGHLQRMIKQEKIRNAVILSAFGSVRGYQVHQVSNRDFPSHDLFVKNPTAPADIIGMSGVVMNGRLHPHITLANADKAFGGHLEPGTRVFTFAVVTLGILDDNLDLNRLDDSTYR